MLLAADSVHRSAEPPHGAERPLTAAISPEALRMLTSAPAFAVFRERQLGTLEAGKFADVTIFSSDIMIAEPAQILKARPTMPIVGGVPSLRQE